MSSDTEPDTANQANQPDRKTDEVNYLAAEVIRNKINTLYGLSEASHEPSARIEEAEVAHLQHRSKHQRYMYELSNSGKSLPEVQTAWHEYYQSLPDEEKRQVWEEFYSEQAKAKQAEAAKVHTPAEAASDTPPAKKTATNQTVDQVKKRLIKQVNSRGKLTTKHHIQSLIFGLTLGMVMVVVLLFGFFNERIIAPFITPSRSVTNTPIIANSGTVSNTPEVIIPKINVQIPVIYDQTSIDEAAVENSLNDGVVHYATTPSPGELGNVVIFGHSSNNILNKGKYKFAFVLLNRLQIGDTFALTKDGKRYEYRVYERKIVKPSEVSVLGPTDKPATATLITCDPPGTSINRLVVIGEQISPDPKTNTASTAVASTQQVTTIPSQSQTLWYRLTHLFGN